MRRLLRPAAIAMLLSLIACGGASGGGDTATGSTGGSPSQLAAASVAVSAPAQSVAASAPVASIADASPDAASTAASARAAPSAKPTPGPDQFANPVIDQDFPDPDVLKVGDTYYAYATNAVGQNIQTAKSTDLVDWEMVGDALPLLPGWARSGLTWAPEVTSWDNGNSFVMYFTARDTASDKQCIGAATGEQPTGPFTGAGDAALVCQAELGGSIDPSSFLDEDGGRFLLWKNDGNCCGFSTYLYIQELSADGLTLQGEPARLITNDKVWEGGLVEAPTLWKHDGKYYLLYSANSYSGAQYAIGYATADAVTGPYEKPSDDPLVETTFGTGVAIGPGGQDIVLDDDGETWLVYHSWDPTISYRGMLLDELVWENGSPVLKGPDGQPQPRP